jgi:stage IV sporulation protein FB
MLRKYNVKIKKLELSIIGGILEYEEINLKFKEVILIDIAGIVGNLLIILLIKLLNIESLQYLITYNIILIIFNLLPIIPLDGFRILKDSLSLIYDDEYTYLLIKNIDIFCLIMLFIILVIFKLYAQLIIWSFLLYKLIKYNTDNKKMLKLVELLKK